MIFATFPWKPSNFKGAGAKSVTAEPMIGRRKRIRADQQMTAPCFREHFSEILMLSDVFLGSGVVVRWSESSFLWGVLTVKISTAFLKDCFFRYEEDCHITRRRGHIVDRSYHESTIKRHLPWFLGMLQM